MLDSFAEISFNSQSAPPRKESGIQLIISKHRRLRQTAELLQLKRIGEFAVAEASLLVVRT